jgi:septum formation protein
LAVCEGDIVGKPGSEGRAIEQLERFSGQIVDFLTAIHVCCPGKGVDEAETVATRVRFRELEPDEIRRYVRRDQPLDCAGSFKSEMAGPALLKAMESDDPTAIVGLPLIACSRLLRRAGIALP